MEEEIALPHPMCWGLRVYEDPSSEEEGDEEEEGEEEEGEEE